MPRLFVAIDLPAAATTELVRIQPPPTAGVRLVEASQMHLTLHHIGETNHSQLAEVLRTVAVPIFPLVVEGVGQFRSAGDAVTMWAGVRANADLLALHAAVATALATVGFQPEFRPYNPHVALARCEQGVPADVVKQYLDRHALFLLPSVPIAAFGLYSSEFVSGVPVYRCERTFPLLLPIE